MKFRQIVSNFPRKNIYLNTFLSKTSKKIENVDEMLSRKGHSGRDFRKLVVNHF